MTETTEPAGVPPAQTVRITASYPQARVGDVELAHPEMVEIEVSDGAVPADTADRIAFVGALVDALFRAPSAPAGVEVQMRGPYIDQLGEPAKPVFAKGGEVR